MTILMARITQGNSIRYFVTKFGIKHISLDMVSANQNINSIAILAGIIIALKNSLTPDLVFSGVSLFGGWTCKAIVRTWWVKLRGNHSSSALMRAKDVTVSALIHLANFRRVTLEFLTAKVTGKDGLMDLKPFISTFTVAIVFLVRGYPGIDALEFLATCLTSYGGALISKLAFNRAVMIVFDTAGHCRALGVSLAASGTDERNRMLTSAFLRAIDLFSIIRMELFFTGGTRFDYCQSS
jgi:hypothetical protein